ncbi:MAG: N-acetylmuramoyl-L-alanine amidase [Bacteroides sp.]
MRLITLIIIHCSAVRTYQTSSAEQIDQWHRSRGWKCIGYHYVIRRDGTIETGRPESMVGAHCLHHNRHSLGICYEGGLNARGEHCDTRTPAQKRALKTLLKQLKTRYPDACITSHRTFNPQKDCPCFDAEREYSQL